MKKLNNRFWQVDFCRGLAVVLMVLFNWSFALSFLNVFTVDGGWAFWWLFPRLIGGSFIFLAGLSVALSSKKLGNRKIILRGFKILLIGIGITLVTWLSYPAYTISFGILHLIGLSIMLSPVFLRFRNLTLFLGSIFLVLGFIISSQTFGSPYFFWLGLTPHGYQSFDYWPLLPWLGVFLLGIFFSSQFLTDIKRGGYVEMPIIKQICFLGRNSLVIYLAHQPVLIALIYFFGFHLF